MPGFVFWSLMMPGFRRCLGVVAPKLLRTVACSIVSCEFATSLGALVGSVRVFVGRAMKSSVWALWQTAFSAVFQGPVGAFCASRGPAASTRRCILRCGRREAIRIEDRELIHRGAPGVRGPIPVRREVRSASQISLVAASSLEKCPRVLMIFRSRAWTLSSALVV